MSKIIVLGCGMVGSAIALDLSKKHTVSVADFSENSLQKIQEKNKGIRTFQLDVTNIPELKKAIQDFDLVMCAVPGFLGFQTLKSCIEAKKNVVDISFFPENALELHQLAMDNEVTTIVDCGVAPGMDNFILGYENEKYELSHFECLVGGLPKVKKWPFAYKAPFSPIDVIEEYTRPARYVENGQLIIKDALSDIEHVEFDGVGTLESFNSDGLRSIIYTMSHIPNMKEKTLRYPGHAKYINVLKSSGFFDTQKINYQGIRISPIEFTSKILFNEWKLNEDEEEMTIMRITLQGKDKQGNKKTIVYNLHDKYCGESKTASMSRTTGYTACAAVHLLLEGWFDKKGVYPPELVGKSEKCFQYVLNYLSERGVYYHRHES
ncbi:MAG: saccharopine dehydrogenase NADP-binding domain-containing protein [Chitinophagaceae bacterium]|nr:MAG: saccharopine dehydrogenase [Bacteroidetes bacterium OLB11]MCC6448787.1 saccharopine dehydrogenase NADP-binding domain-containing protein [Chitinophagaceae bacterium]HMN31780.1 saccharopine dehydrogenase C-terminal domain-containing protein [Chitinophagaceae bacterium]